MARIRTGIEIRGLKDLTRALKDIDAQLPKELADLNQQVGESVISGARGRASTPLEHRAARTLKAARQQRVVLIRLGGGRYPEALGAEFGAGQGTLRNTTRGVMEGWNQFRPWRGSGGDAGYFLFPTIREDTPQIIDRHYDLIYEFVQRHFT